MKILYIHTIDIFSEKANVIQVLEMCNAFAENNVSVNLLIESSTSRSNDILEQIKKKIRLDEIKFKISCNNYVAGIKISNKYIKWIILIVRIIFVKNEIIFVRHPLLLLIASVLRKKVIFESHNKLPESYKKFQIESIFIREACKKFVICFIAISQNLADYWISKGINNKKVIVLHDGVRAEVFTPKKTKEFYKALLKFDKEKIEITYAGSIYKNRNIERICMLAHTFPNINFNIIGGSREDIVKLKENNKCNSNNLTFYGYLERERMLKIIWASDYLLMIWSNDVETINFCSPLKMFEYMASKRIIIGQEFPTIKEVLNNGEDAFLVNPNSYEDLEIKISQLIKSDYNSTIAENAYKKVIDNYTWKKRTASIITVVKDEANNK